MNHFRISSRRRFRRLSSQTILRILLLLSVLIKHGDCKSINTTYNLTPTLIPTVYVFFEPITKAQRFTSMSDEDDAALLDFWKQAWTEAGWLPRVLTLQDAKKHSLYDEFQNELDSLCMDEFGKLSLLRWLAFAALGGGWMADYDAFALQSAPGTKVFENNGQVTIYEAVAPVVVSGSADALTNVAIYLLEHAKSHGRASQGRLSFWTDTLGLLSAWRDPNCTLHVKKDVLDGRKAVSGKALTRRDCDKKPFRGNRFIHFGHFCMMEAPAIAPELRLPRHRLDVAKKWLPEWSAACGGGGGGNATNVT
jgi:hypothetical protein